MSIPTYLPRKKESRWEYGYGGIKTVPGHSRLAALPHRARIAITLRCSLRVRPYFDVAWPEAPWAIKQVLDHLNRFAAATSEARNTMTRTRLTFHQVAGFCELCRIHAWRYQRESPARRHVIASANILSLAMEAGLTADPTMSSGMIGRPKDRSSESYKGNFRHFSCDRAARAICSVSAVGCALWHDWDNVKHTLTTELRRDFSKVERHSKRKQTNDETPFPQDLFGDMWTSRPPKVIRLSARQWQDQLLANPQPFA